MGDTIFSVIKDIFKKEYDKFVLFCRKRKIFVTIFLIFLILIIADFKFSKPPIIPFLFESFIDCLKQIPQWLTTLVFGAWLIFLTFFVLGSRRWGLTFRGDFFDAHPDATLLDWSMARYQFWVDNNCTAALQRYEEVKNMTP